MAGPYYAPVSLFCLEQRDRHHGCGCLLDVRVLHNKHSKPYYIHTFHSICSVL